MCQQLVSLGWHVEYLCGSAEFKSAIENTGATYHDRNAVCAEFEQRVRGHKFIDLGKKKYIEQQNTGGNQRFDYHNRSAKRNKRDEQQLLKQAKRTRSLERVLIGCHSASPFFFGMLEDGLQFRFGVRNTGTKLVSAESCQQWMP